MPIWTKIIRGKYKWGILVGGVFIAGLIYYAFYFPGPDLVVSQIDVKTVDFCTSCPLSSCTVGLDVDDQNVLMSPAIVPPVKFRIEAEVANVGMRPTEATTKMTCRITNPVGTSMESHDIHMLKPNEPYRSCRPSLTSFYWIVQQVADYTVACTVNPNEDLPETDYSNNTRTITFEYGG